jgi:hypothetical protein
MSNKFQFTIIIASSLFSKHGFRATDETTVANMIEAEKIF